MNASWRYFYSCYSVPFKKKKFLSLLFSVWLMDQSACTVWIMVSIILCILALDVLKSQRIVWRDFGYLEMKEPFCWIMYYLYYIYFWPCEGRNEGWHQLLLMEMSCLKQWFSLVCRNNCALSGLTIHATELEHVTLDKCYGGTAYSLCVCVCCTWI